MDLIAQPIDACIKAQIAGPVEAKVKVELPDEMKSRPFVVVDTGVQIGNPCNNTIAIIEVDSLLINRNPSGPYSAGENPVAMFTEKLAMAATDPSVRGVVLRVNSPGGAVDATELMWHEIEKFKQHTGKPIVAFVSGLGAGGGYYLASNCDAIVTLPTAIVGGIGVIFNSFDLADTMAQFNVFEQTVKAGKLIDVGTSLRPMEDEERKVLQKIADELHQRFQDVVVRGRPKLKNAPKTIFDGRIFSASQSKAVGLTDTIGYLETAAQIVCSRAKKSGARLIMYRLPSQSGRSPYATISNEPMQSSILGSMSIPGIDRSRSPTFMYLWQPEPSVERLTGR